MPCIALTPSNTKLGAYVVGICGNQAFPEMPRQFRKCLEFPQMPGQLRKIIFFHIYFEKFLILGNSRTAKKDHFKTKLS